jgi:hypothetical protein
MFRRVTAVGLLAAAVVAALIVVPGSLESPTPNGLFAFVVTTNRGSTRLVRANRAAEPRRRRPAARRRHTGLRRHGVGDSSEHPEIATAPAAHVSTAEPMTSIANNRRSLGSSSAPGR